jgi:WD40 repeat protein
VTGSLRVRTAAIVAGSCLFAVVTVFGSAAAAGVNAERIDHSHRGGQATQDGGRIVAVAGSSLFLAYIKYSTVNGQPAQTGQLYERTAEGTEQKLGTVRVLNDPLLENMYSISGRYLAAGSIDGGKVRVWNLNNGREHDRTVPHHTSEMAAAPNGYLVAKSRKGRVGNQKLETVSMSGTVRSLGSPYPPGTSYRVTVNTHRWVAFRNGGEARPWGAKTATFAHPRHVTTLIGSRGRGSTPTTYCGAPGPHFVACDTDSHQYQLQMHKFNGKLAAHTGDFDANYQPAPAVSARSTFWLTQAPDQQLRQLSASGTVTHSTQMFADDGPIAAFHKIVVGDPEETTLFTVKSATAKPTVLVPPTSSA